MAGAPPSSGGIRRETVCGLRIATPGSVVRVLVVLAALFLGGAWVFMLPGHSYSGPWQPLTADEVAVREVLRGHLERLAGDIGERHTGQPARLAAAARYIEAELRQTGLAPERQDFVADGTHCANLSIQIAGGRWPDRIVVVGAHYDTIPDSPGADDNTTGTAAVLALAKAFAASRPERTLRFVAFANEEPPHFQTATMGSLVYARACRARGERVAAMLSLESIGYYSDEPGSQHYPPPLDRLYPGQGNFLAFVGNPGSRGLLRRSVAGFRRHCLFPSEGALLPAMVAGVGWSDHWAFWECRYPAVMVTDTVPYRYPFYHTPEDTVDRLDLDRLARAVWGLRAVVADLAGVPALPAAPALPPHPLGVPRP